MSRRLAVLLTCFNRRATTLRCLGELEAQEGLDEIEVQTYLVDDGSTDGTGDAVRAAHPSVHVLQGTGSLYWTGGMHLADAAAWEARPDYLLWLNDDVQLNPDALRVLLEAVTQTANASIVVGPLHDPDTAAVSYGGYVRRDQRRPLVMERLEPNGSIQPADTMNGNVVLIPREVREVVGPLDLRFSHNMADMDYGFRATAAGFGVVVAPTFVGACSPNPSKNRWSDGSVPVRQRLRALRSFKGLPPREWYAFTRRYCGWRWPRYFVSPYVRMLLASHLDEERGSPGSWNHS